MPDDRLQNEPLVFCLAALLTILRRQSLYDGILGVIIYSAVQDSYYQLNVFCRESRHDEFLLFRFLCY